MTTKNSWTIARYQRTTEYRELKRSIGGEERVFACEALSVIPRLAILRFVSTRPVTAGGLDIPSGAFTLGFFWRTRHYNLYHMLTADGELIADRFDVVDGVRIGGDQLRYVDLLLDVWRRPDGRIEVEDEDEVQDAIVAGRLSPRRQRIIARTLALLQRRSAAIGAEALGELRRVTPQGGGLGVSPKDSFSPGGAEPRALPGSGPGYGIPL